MKTLSPQQRLVAYIVLVFIIDYLSVVNLPFLWSETFFHEISHGLAALLTGGYIHNITLNFDGSGVCTTSGGSRFLVSFSGYAGSALWGGVIYSVADALTPAKARLIAVFLIAMLTITLVFWARNFSTIVILIVLLMMYTLPLFKSLWVSVKFLIQLIGIFVMLDAIRSPLYLLDDRNIGDGENLAKLTWMPEIFWVLIWFAMSVGCLYLLWRFLDDKSIKESS